MTETEFHYIDQLFLGLPEISQHFVLKDLESRLNPEQVIEITGLVKETQTMFSNIAESIDDERFAQIGQFNPIYFEMMCNYLDNEAFLSVMHFIEKNFTKRALDNFMEIAVTRTEQTKGSLAIWDEWVSTQKEIV